MIRYTVSTERLYNGCAVMLVKNCMPWPGACANYERCRFRSG
jgi:hypothetical protein